ncbi:MAG: flagellar basal body-associated FliL family protein [Candidatus Binatia bacterium]
MAETKADAAQDGAPAAEQKGGKGKLFIILGVVALLAAGGAGYVLFLRKPPPDADAEAAVESGEHAGGEKAAGHGGGHGGGGGGKAAAEMGAIEALDPFIANLADEDGRRYLKATLQLEFFDAHAPDDLNAHMPQIRDLVLTLFTSKTFADIRTPEGKGLLREEIINRINRVLRHDVVKAIYFTEFIVQ